MSVLIRGTPSGRGAALPKTALEPGQPGQPPRPRFVNQAGAAAFGVLFQMERANPCNERPSSALRKVRCAGDVDKAGDRVFPM